MKVCVFGLWHLGCVTAACLAELGIEVVGLDFDEKTVSKLKKSIAPIFEPGLNELISKNLNINLTFTTDLTSALKDADYLWITFDTPVDDQDNADVSYILDSTEKVFECFNTNIKIIISSQVPVGSTRRLIDSYNESVNKRNVKFCYSPENLRLGKAIDIFLQPDRIVIGSELNDRDEYEKLFSKISKDLVWMSIESAEVTKHAINAFLATSATFANEIATICEHVSADAKEVEIGLKTEQRIGVRAYVAPGSAIAGGTLNRDIVFLNKLASEFNFSASLLNGVKVSNDSHKMWAKYKASQQLGGVQGKNIGILGLTYKPGTDTLRRSLAIEICNELHSEGATIKAFDPSIKKIEDTNLDFIELMENTSKVFSDADCVILCTEWSDFKNCLDRDNIDTMSNRLVIDCNGFMLNTAKRHTEDLQYITFGRK